MSIADHPWVLRSVAAFLGGFGAYLIKINFFNAPGETKGKFMHALVYASFSAMGGMLLLDPPNSGNAFAAGLIGVAAMTNYFHQNNEGASGERLTRRTLEPVAIRESYKDEIDQQ